MDSFATAAQHLDGKSDASPPSSVHWHHFGIGLMKMESWDIIVFCRNHSIYVNTSLMAKSIGLSAFYIRKVIGKHLNTERMTQLQVSILRYLQYLSASTRDTGLVPLLSLLETLFRSMKNQKTKQNKIKTTIKTILDKFHDHFLPAIHDLPHDLTAFFHSNCLQQNSASQKNELVKIVTYLKLKERLFSLLECNGDFYMHLGELVSNGLFSNLNFVRRKIRKMHIRTKWLNFVESQTLNLSQDKELVKFNDLRTLCSIILYLHPDHKTDLLQEFSVMDLPKPISFNNNNFNFPKSPQIKNSFEEFQDSSPKLNPNFPMQNEILNAASLSTNYTITQNHLQTNSLPDSGVPHAEHQNHLQTNTTPYSVVSYPQSIDPINKHTKLNLKDLENKNQKLIAKNVSEMPDMEELVLCRPTISCEESLSVNGDSDGGNKMDLLDIAYKEVFEESIIDSSSFNVISSDLHQQSDWSIDNGAYRNLEEQSDLNHCHLDCQIQNNGFDYFYSSDTSVSDGNDQNEKADKFLRRDKPNRNFLEQSRCESLFQSPEVSKSVTSLHNSAYNTDHQMLPRQFIDSTVNPMAATNLFPVTINTFGSSPFQVVPSTPEIFTGPKIDALISNRLGKIQTDPQEYFEFVSSSKSMDGSSTNQYNQSKSKVPTNQSLIDHSTPFSLHIKDNNQSQKEMFSSSSSLISKKDKFYNNRIQLPFLNIPTLDNNNNNDGLLDGFPQILPIQEENSNQEPDLSQNDSLVTIPSYKIMSTPSKTLLNKTFQKQDYIHQNEENYLYETNNHFIPYKNQFMELFSKSPGENDFMTNNATSVKDKSSEENQSNNSISDFSKNHLDFYPSPNHPGPLRGSGTSMLLSGGNNKIQTNPLLPTTTESFTSALNSSVQSSPDQALNQFSLSPQTNPSVANLVIKNNENTLNYLQQETTPKSSQPITTLHSNVNSITATKQRLFKKASVLRPPPQPINQKLLEIDDQRELPHNLPASNIKNSMKETSNANTQTPQTNQGSICGPVSLNKKTKKNLIMNSAIFEIKSKPSKRIGSFESKVKDPIIASERCVIFNSHNKGRIIKMSNLDSENSLSANSFNLQNFDKNSLSTNPTFSTENLVLNNSNNRSSGILKQQPQTELDERISLSSKMPKRCFSKSIKEQEAKIEHQSKKKLKSSCDKEIKRKICKMDCIFESLEFSESQNQLNHSPGIISRNESSLKSPSVRATLHEERIPSPDLCPSRNIDVLTPSPSTHSQPLTVLDIVDIMKLKMSANHLHVEVAFTNEAKEIFKNKKENSISKEEDRFLQELAESCCQFSKRWFAYHSAKIRQKSQPEFQE